MNTGKRTILITGGAGYIGAHTVRALMQAGHTVLVIDDLSSGKKSNVVDGAHIYVGDFADIEILEGIFSKHSVDAVMHFAASIEVGESVEKPLEYLDNNTLKTAQLVQAMLKHNVNRIIFSSTAAVYGLQKTVPISETAKTGPLDPYGYSKLLSEHLLHFYSQFAGLQAIVFRYFNACGSDFDKTIYSTHESHLIPRVIDVAEGRRPLVEIYGTDYDTVDGTGVRDYVHVLDVARAHVHALQEFDNQNSNSKVHQTDAENNNFEIFNIGTSEGLSVRQIIQAVEEITGKTITVEEKKRREGDSPITVADNAKIRHKFSFELKHSDLKTIIQTSWH